MSKEQPNIKVIWFALFMSQFIYLAIPNLVELLPPKEPPEDVLLMVLGVIGISNVVIAFVLPTILKKVESFQLAILQYAVLESCAIIGFAGVFLGAPNIFHYVLAFLAMAGMVALFPKNKVKGRTEEEM